MGHKFSVIHFSRKAVAQSLRGVSKNTRLQAFELLAVALMASFNTQANDSFVLEKGELKRQLIDNLPEGFFTPLTVPSEPIPVGTLYPEWAPSNRVLISVPLSELFQYPELLSFVTDFLVATVPHVPVGLLYNREEEMHLGRFLLRIETHPELAPHINRIEFIESSVYGFWIRDHGPQFARSMKGDLLILDSIYRVLEFFSMPDIQQPLPGKTLNQKRYLDDLTPLYVGQYLRSKRDMEAVVVKSPLHIHGGDFATDGAGNVFTSENTITENGSEWEFVEKVFNNYYGANTIHILNSPDGNTAKHLDVLFKIVSEETYFVSQLPQLSKQASSHDRLLSRQISRTLANNLDYLRRQLPSVKVVQLPMPSLLVKSRAERIQSFRNEIVNVVSRRANVDWNSVLQGNDPESAELNAAQNALALEMLVGTGINVDLTNETHLDIAGKHYLGVGIEDFLETYVNREAVYRSYTNSLIVRNAESETLILLPRFLPQEGESADNYKAMEETVEGAYLKVYPDAQIKWIHSDEIAAAGGSLHCMSVSVPVLESHKGPRVLD